MRVVGGLVDRSGPPRWVSRRTGEILPIPDTTPGRLAYALDLTFTMRGTSWISSRYWDFLPSYLAAYSPPPSRAKFVLRAIGRFAMTYLVFDACDTIYKLINFDTSSPYPVTSLPILQQLGCTILECVWHIAGMEFLYRLFMIFCVGTGLTPDTRSWPPLFNAPFASANILEFWSKRWHVIFRYATDRVSAPFLRPYVRPPRKLVNKHGAATATPLADPVEALKRATIAFAWTASTHLVMIHRVPPDAAHPHYGFWDRSVLTVFLIQPVGLVVDIGLARLGNGLRVRLARRIWVWGWILWTARWWCDAYTKKGLLDRDEPYVEWSPVRGIIWGDWSAARSMGK